MRTGNETFTGDIVLVIMRDTGKSNVSDNARDDHVIFPTHSLPV